MGGASLYVDEIGLRLYMRRHDRDAHFHPAPLWPCSGRGGRTRWTVTCGRGFRGVFLPKFDAVSGFRRHLLRRET